nr:hypothetical protein BaRGS_024853 [Batillaria attramentaria]
MERVEVYSAVKMLLMAWVVMQMNYSKMKVYFMETTPRGKLLIINNERFDCVRMKNREGTQEDAKALKDLFEKRLGFHVEVANNFLEDTAVGPRRLQPDLTTPECSTDTPNYADQYFLFATVENYVAYRNKFVELLVGVFEQHAGLLHIKDLATELHNEMSKFKHEVRNQNAPTGNANQQITDHIFTMGEACATLTKHWYLNPLGPSA